MLVSDKPCRDFPYAICQRRNAHYADSLAGVSNVATPTPTDQHRASPFGSGKHAYAANVTCVHHKTSIAMLALHTPRQRTNAAACLTSFSQYPGPDTHFLKSGKGQRSREVLGPLATTGS